VEIERTRTGPGRHPHRPAGHLIAGAARGRRIRSELEKLTKKQSSSTSSSEEPEADASWSPVTAEQLSNRVSFRRAMRKPIQSAMRSPQVKGIRVQCSGARRRRDVPFRALPRGPVPLHTSADIDYGFFEHAPLSAGSA